MVKIHDEFRGDGSNGSGRKATAFLAVADWPIDDFTPNAYLATATVIARTGKTPPKVATGMVHEAILSGR